MATDLLAHKRIDQSLVTSAATIISRLLRHGHRTCSIAQGSSVLLLLVFALTTRAAVVTWDSLPGSASPGPNDGNGNWGATTDNTNWWNGVANVAWNNANGDTAVLGVDTASAVTVTLTNNVVVGGLIYSNVGTGVYTLAGSSSLTFSGGSAAIQLSGPNGTYVVSPSLVATGALSITSTTTNSGIMFRCAASAMTSPVCSLSARPAPHPMPLQPLCTSISTTARSATS
jgi:hypothetical protein